MASSQPFLSTALPLVFYPILSALSIAMFVLLLSLLAVIVDGRYQCDQYIKIAVGVLSMTIIYFVDIVLFILLIYLGWRGSPLNEAKRMPQMSVLVHLWVVCAIIKAGFTGFGLFVLYSPRISKSCWSSNPCDFYGQTTLAQSCVPGATGEVKLTEPCLVVFKNFDSYSECIEQWTSYAGGWMESNFKGVNQTTGDGIFYIPSLVNNCSTVDIGTAGFLRLLNQQDIRYYQERLSPAQEGPQSQFDQVFEYFILKGMMHDDPAFADRVMKGDITADEASRIFLENNFVSKFMDDVTRYAMGNDSVTAAAAPWDACLPEESFCRYLFDQDCRQWQLIVNLPNVYRWRQLFEAVVWISVAVIFLTVFVFAFSFNAFPDYESKESWEGLLTGIAKKIESYADYDPTWMSGVGNLLWGLFGGVDLDFTDLLLGMYLVWVRQKWKRKELVRRLLEAKGYSIRTRQENFWWSTFGGLLLYPIGLDGRLFSGRRWREWWYRRRRNNRNNRVFDEGGGEQKEGRNEGWGEELEAEQQPVHHRKPPIDDDMYLTLEHSMARIPSIAPDCDVNRSSSSIKRVSATDAAGLVEESTQNRAFLTPLELRNLQFVGPEPDQPVEQLYLGRSQPSDRVDTSTLEMLRRYLPFARASYGLNRGAWKACSKYRWYHWGYRLNNPAYFERMNFQMLVEMMGVAAEGVIHASYDLGTHLKPYLVVRDGDDAIVSIRGTVDLITDLLSQPIDEGDGTFYHVGMLSSARAIVADMREKGIWDELVSRCGGGHIGDGTVCLGGKVVFTGHSLGAGLAYLVAVELLKCGADQSRLACIAFNPPGGLSSDTSSRLETHYSVIVNKDAISRMSITTMKRLVDDVMFSLVRCRRPKLSVFFDGVLLGRYVASDWTGLFKPFESLHAEEIEVLYVYLKKGKLSAKSSEYVLPMYPPGKLVFLRMLRDDAWDAVWIRAEDLMDEGLLVDWGMARDHLLGTTLAGLDKAIVRTRC